MKLIDSISGDTLIPNMTIATTYKQRLIGLLGSTELADDSAVCFHNCNSVHMFGMRYAIDVIYLDQDSKVTKLVKGLKPWRASFSKAAATTIEVQAGSCQRLNLRTGQHLLIEA